MSTKRPAPLPKVNTFGIAFDTKSDTKHGYIRVTTVTLGEDIMDVNDTVRVDLCEHPLYLQLQQYVLANPR